MSAAAGNRSRPWAAGALAVVFFAVHCQGHIRRGELHDLLWLSNLATLILAGACLLGSARAAATAMLWLSLSAVLWLLDVAVAGAPVDTAVLTHLGSLALAVYAVRALGMPARTWRYAASGLAALVGLSRLVTERRHNVNLSFSIADGWGAWLPSFGVYLALLAALSTALFLLVEHAARRILGPTPR